VPISDPLAQVLPVYRVTVDPALAVPFNVTEAWLVMSSVLLDPVSSPAIRSGMLTVKATVSAVITGVFTAAWVSVAVLPAASVRDPVKVLAAMVMAPLSVPWMV
jgi:hypothetical protein